MGKSETIQWITLLNVSYHTSTSGGSLSYRIKEGGGTDGHIT